MTLRYSGPMCALDLGDAGEVTLVEGRLYRLPADHPRVAALVRQDRLAPDDGQPGEIAIEPRIVRALQSHGPDRNMLADVIRVMKDGVEHPDVAAEADAATARTPRRPGRRARRAARPKGVKPAPAKPAPPKEKED